uniref:glucokinase n=1 Tax=Sphingomonas sp. TaxID=28214 RepID=UPI0035AE639B
VGHAVAQVSDEHFLYLCGPDEPLPATGITTVCGPGTGLGVAQVFKTDGYYHVLETEGGHMDYSPLDAIEDAFLRRLRRTFTRVSAERICSGPGIVAIYETLAEMEGRAVPSRDDKAIWTEALEGTDSIALAALDRFCLALGAVAGDFALVQGAKGVVIAGGLGFRIKDKLIRSGFDQRFVAKGRFQSMMAKLPVKLITHPQPGLFGAAAAFAQQHTA